MKKILNKNLSRDESTRKRRELILETAIECFVLKGFHQTSIRDIANSASISLGGLYNHFDSKDALISEIAVLEAVELEKFEMILAKYNDPLVAIENFSSEYLHYIQQQPNATLTVEITAEAIRNPIIAEGFIANRKKMSESVSSVLSKGIELKQFDPKMNTKEVAELIIDLVEGLGLRSAFLGKKTSKVSRASLQYMIKKCLSI